MLLGVAHLCCFEEGVCALQDTLGAWDIRLCVSDGLCPESLIPTAAACTLACSPGDHCLPVDVCFGCMSVGVARKVHGWLVLWQLLLLGIYLLIPYNLYQILGSCSAPQAPLLLVA